MDDNGLYSSLPLVKYGRIMWDDTAALMRLTLNKVALMKQPICPLITVTCNFKGCGDEFTFS